MIKANSMKKFDEVFFRFVTLILVMIMVSSLSAQIAVKGEKIYTMSYNKTTEKFKLIEKQ